MSASMLSGSVMLAQPASRLKIEVQSCTCKAGPEPVSLTHIRSRDASLCGPWMEDLSP